MLTAAAYDIHVEQLLERMRKFHAAMQEAEIPYRIIGGLATFIQVNQKDPNLARLTKDIDAAIFRADLPRVIKAAELAGFRYRHDAGIDMLLDPVEPKAKSAVHLVFVGEKVRADYLEPIPASLPDQTDEGIRIAPVKGLLIMKLTSFRLKDKVHVQDMDSVGLITPEIESALTEPLQARLAEVRATE